MRSWHLRGTTVWISGAVQKQLGAHNRLIDHFARVSIGNYVFSALHGEASEALSVLSLIHAVLAETRPFFTLILGLVADVFFHAHKYVAPAHIWRAS